MPAPTLTPGQQRWVIEIWHKQAGWPIEWIAEAYGLDVSIVADWRAAHAQGKYNACTRKPYRRPFVAGSRLDRVRLFFGDEPLSIWTEQGK